MLLLLLLFAVGVAALLLLLLMLFLLSFAADVVVCLANSVIYSYCCSFVADGDVAFCYVVVAAADVVLVAF